MGKDAKPHAVALSDYRPPDFTITATELNFDINDGFTDVTADLTLVRRPDSDAQQVCLDGQDLELLGVSVDGRSLADNEFAVDDDSLTLLDVPAECQLTLVTRVHPEQNTALEGLYRSKTMYATQCEAQGFRKITYYLDRPDVLARFTTHIVADAARYPVTLSNGNLVADTDVGDGRRRVTWHDPFPKPSYLFALVAGDLAVLEDQFETASGRSVALQIFSEPHNIDQCGYAMDSLKRAMRWDERAYGREYDLDVFMIVAVEDFNMGAMENKGLNIFNTSCVLASPDTATDATYQRVEGVVAHEYFHNWSGNRVTCRDWFQLSLKEGFTVLRDAEFSADMNSATVKRIEDVSFLRTFQFPEDSGPLAHPIRPDTYIEISNFYTTTVYEKGAEVVRMIRTLLGDERFRRGTDLYFERHDGQAATTEDFVVAMEAASGVDLTRFRRWYRQAGTPMVSMTQQYADGTYELTLGQSCPPTPGQDDKEPFHLPIAIGLLDEGGRELLGAAAADSLTVTSDATVENPNQDGTLVVHLTEETANLQVSGLQSRPVLSPLRGFSAPVRLTGFDQPEELAFLVEHDSDGFVRWDAMRRLQSQCVDALRRDAEADVALLSLLYGRLLDAARNAPDDAARNAPEDGEQKALLAAMLALPAEGYLHEEMAEIDVDGVHDARERLLGGLATGHQDAWRALYASNQPEGPYRAEAAEMARRGLKNIALGYICAAPSGEGGDSGDSVDLLEDVLATADNLTDRLAALRALLDLDNLDDARRQGNLEAFYTTWKDAKLVVDQWFSVQAASQRSGSLERIIALEGHDAFDRLNPNRVRALYGAFCGQNMVHFHASGGSGYDFLAERVLALDATNPQLAARLLTPLTRWGRHEPRRAGLMRRALHAIESAATLSPDVYEMVTKSLAEAPDQAT